MALVEQVDRQMTLETLKTARSKELTTARANYMRIEAERGKRDVIYQLSDRKNHDLLRQLASKVCASLFATYGMRMEKLTELAEPAYQRKELIRRSFVMDEQESETSHQFVHIFEWAQNVRDADVTWFIVLFGLSRSVEMQDELVSIGISDELFFRSWVKRCVLPEVNACFLMTGCSTRAAVLKCLVDYVIRADICSRQ